jgi:hypothetical protein
MDNKIAAYSEKKKNVAVIWILFLFLGWSYGSLGKPFLQVLYYVTLGGVGLWLLIRLFTLNGAIREVNKKIAMECGFTNEELVQFGLVK